MSFDDYRGQPDLLEHAKSTVKILQGEGVRGRGGEMPKGMLLSGQPGTGKTFLAGCIAAEAKLPFIYIDASSLRGMFLGMTALMVMKLFRDARGLARKYARQGKRGAMHRVHGRDRLDRPRPRRAAGDGHGHRRDARWRQHGLNTMLNQMDSLGDHVEDRCRRKILRWFGLIRGPVHRTSRSCSSSARPTDPRSSTRR